MYIGKYRFRPTLAPTLAAAVLLPVMLMLAFWQLNRADEKRELLEAMAAAAQAPAVDLSAERRDADALLYRSATAQGMLDRERVFALNNQRRDRDGAMGWRVLVPLRLDTEAVLIDWGWVDDLARIEQLPHEPVTVTGRVDEGPSVALRLGPAGTGAEWPRELYYVDFDYVREQVPYPVAAFMVRPEYEGEAVPLNMPPEKHVGYAVQWFAMAGVLVLLYFFLNLRREKLRVDN